MLKGVELFIQVAKQHLWWDNKTCYPCRDCQNAWFNDLLKIECHLIKLKFLKINQRCIFRGKEHESPTNGQNDVSVDTRVVDATDDDILNEVIDALNDACGPINKDINLGESISHGKIDYLFDEANKELYLSCRKFFTLTFLVKLMPVKIVKVISL